MPKRVAVRRASSAPPDFRLSDGARRFDIDDHAVIGVDQIVIGIGEEGVSLVRRSIAPPDRIAR